MDVLFVEQSLPNQVKTARFAGKGSDPPYWCRRASRRWTLSRPSRATTRPFLSYVFPRLCSLDCQAVRNLLVPTCLNYYCSWLTFSLRMVYILLYLKTNTPKPSALFLIMLLQSKEGIYALFSLKVFCLDIALSGALVRHDC